MAEHLGVLTKESREKADWNHTLLDDPVCDEFYHNVWCRIAESNMKIFDDVSLLSIGGVLKFRHLISAQLLRLSLGPSTHLAALEDHECLQGIVVGF